MIEDIARILKTTLKNDAPILLLERLHGDASARSYFRLKLANKQSFIIMKLPEGPASVSEEISNFKVAPKELPFINVGRFLKQQGLPVPEILTPAPQHDLLFVEDLGDETMEMLILEGKSGEKLAWYKKAIDLLTQIQRKLWQLKSGCLAFERSFNETLYNWEFDHFREYGIEARLQKNLSNSERTQFESFSRKISKQIATLPQHFTHRDFQSRNLIAQKGSLYILDFQDALLGPPHYDLVSLLRDSYVELTPQGLEEMIRYYLEKSKDYFQESAETFTHNFHLITTQRKLKDAGRFVYIDRVKKNPKFLKHLPTSLKYAQEAFSHLPDQEEFYKFLQSLIPEWRP